MIANLPRWIWILVVGGLLILPSLGTYGLWDPGEIREADVAQEVAEKGSFADVTVDGQYANRPLLKVWLVAAGFKLLGVSELAGRLPIALCGLVALLLAFRVGKRLVCERAGLVAAFVLGTTPTFIFQSRQMLGDLPFYACLVASVGGLAAFLWPADGRRSTFDLAIGALGLVLGFIARGLLLGTIFPLICLAIAVASALSSRHLAAGRAWPAEDGPQLKRGQTVAEALRSAAPRLGLTLVIVAAAIGLLVALLPNREFLLLGGELRSVSIPPQMQVAFRDLGFGMYPWFALVPIALLAFLWSPHAETRNDPAIDAAGGPQSNDADAGSDDAAAGSDDADAGSDDADADGDEDGSTSGSTSAVIAAAAGRDALIKYLVVSLAVVGYGAAVVWGGYLGKLHFPALPWLAIGVAFLFHQVWVEQARHRLWGMVAAALILVLHQDFVMAPESLAFSHLLQQGKYPAELDIKTAMRLFGVALALLAFFALGGNPRLFEPTQLARRVTQPWLRRRPVLGWIGRVPGLGVGLRWVIFAFAWLIDRTSHVASLIAEGVRFLGGRQERSFWLAGAVVALAFAGWCAHYLTPQLSQHLSNKALFGTYHACKKQGERLAQYLVTGRGAAYYNDGQVDRIRSQADLFRLLRQAERTFVLMPAGHLGAVDKAARQAKVNYYVLDDSNSQYLIISNKLAGKCNEDKNPLRKFVLRSEPKIKKRIRANFENRVQLLGYDVDDSVSRGGKFKITMYYKVLGRMPANYKIFIHFDQPAHRFHGDHKPLDGKYPTQYWLPGDYIVDPHEVEIPMLTTPTGRYRIMTGFWLGSRRLKVVEGPNDGSDRVPVGMVRVRAF